MDAEGSTKRAFSHSVSLSVTKLLDGMCVWPEVSEPRGEVGGTVSHRQSLSAFHANAMLLNEFISEGQVDDFDAE